MEDSELLRPQEGGTADCFVEDSIFYLVVTFPCGKSQKETA